MQTLRVRRGIDRERDEILDAFKFICDPTRYRFKIKILPACKIYVHQKNDLNTILQSFKVQKTPCLYPLACQGYGLGASLRTWRVNGARPNFLKEIKAL